jgi:hypothetical protein
MPRRCGVPLRSQQHRGEHDEAPAGFEPAKEPLSGPVERPTDRVQLAAHLDALHETPRSVGGGEAVGRQAAQSEIFEAESDQLPNGLGGVPVARMIGVHHPAQLGVSAAGLVHDLCLGPRVVDPEHQVTDHQAVELES